MGFMYKTYAVELKINARLDGNDMKQMCFTTVLEVCQHSDDSHVRLSHLDGAEQLGYVHVRK